MNVSTWSQNIHTECIKEIAKNHVDVCWSGVFNAYLIHIRTPAKCRAQFRATKYYMLNTTWVHITYIQIRDYFMFW